MKNQNNRNKLGFTLVPDIEQISIRNTVKSIGKKLQKRRQELNYTQASLAEALNVSVSSISQIEIGARCPSFTMFLRVCNVLKLDINLNSNDLTTNHSII